MVNNKKAISPVVATALLLVVAVVAVVGFQTWFATFQSEKQADIEQKADSGVSITVELLQVANNGTVTLKNTANTNVTITSWKVIDSDGTEMCTVTTGLGDAGASTVTSFDNSAGTDCGLTSGQYYDVVVMADSGVITETEKAR